MLPLILMLMGAVFDAPPSSAMEAKSEMTCHGWMAQRHDGQASGETHIAADGICFDGFIDSKSAAQFVATMNKNSIPTRITIVVRSGGGDVEAGMIMGRAILQHRADVRVQDICLSSCANYLLAAGGKRTVPEGALVGFHGGVRRLRPDEVINEIGEQGGVISNEEAATISSKLILAYRHQVHFANDAHIKTDFFDWMERFNALPYPKRQEICRGLSDETEFLIFSPDLLAAKGYRLSEYNGPRSERELQRTLNRDGWPIDYACFIPKSAGRF